MPLVRRTRATLRSAEFGFFGVVVYTRVHTPRRCGLPLRAAVLVLETLSRRPLRTSWLMVGIDRLSLFSNQVSGTSCLCHSSFSPCSRAVFTARGRACRAQRAARNPGTLERSAALAGLRTEHKP